MISGLPESAVVHQQLPKKAIYEKFGLTGQEKSRLDQFIHKCRMSLRFSAYSIAASAQSFIIIPGRSVPYGNAHI